MLYRADPRFHPDPRPTPVLGVALTLTLLLHDGLLQEDLKYLEASEDKNEEFYGGGGGGAAGGRPLEHFPQLWCPNGTYSAYGQVCPLRFNATRDTLTIELLRGTPQHVDATLQSQYAVTVGGLPDAV